MAGVEDIITRVGDRTLTLTNLDKVLYPSVGFTKAEVIDYYARIAPLMLPHIRDRAMTRLRFPDGVGADKFSFYEKNAPMGTPDWVRRVNVNTSDGIIDYVVADDEATIVWLANLAALEMHVPQWTVSSATAVDNIISLPELERRPGEPLADRLVVDLDPGAGMTIVESARAALIVAVRSRRPRVARAFRSTPRLLQLAAKPPGAISSSSIHRCTRLNQTSSSRPCRSTSARAGSTSTTTRTWQHATPLPPTRCEAGRIRQSQRR
jgi:hypothetical protein